MKLPGHLYPFQAEDAAELASGSANRLLLLPPGAGKSVITLAAAEALDAFTILVVCPAIVRSDWHAKALRFGRQNYSTALSGDGRRMVVVSYEQLNTPERRQLVLDAMKRIDVLVLDEGQRVKSIEAAVTRSIYGEHAEGNGLIARASRVWPLSGTIAPNHWGELYTHIRALFPQRLPLIRGAPMRYWDFIDRYCEWEATLHGYKVMGNKRPDELRQMLADTAIRRGRAEVDKLLPLLTVDTVLLPEDELEDWASYRALVDSKAGQALAQAATMDEIWTVTPHLSAARRILGELKAPAVARYVRELLEQDSEARILVFGWHRSAMARIANDLFDIEPRIRVIDGDMAGSDRDFAVARFQAGESRVLILGLATAREGITLTAANRVVFAEASWTPTQNEQAIKRAHRIGQTRPVIAQFLCIENTLDQAVMATCVRKSGLLSEIN